MTNACKCCAAYRKICLELTIFGEVEVPKPVKLGIPIEIAAEYVIRRVITFFEHDFPDFKYKELVILGIAEDDEPNFQLVIDSFKNGELL